MIIMCHIQLFKKALSVVLDYQLIFQEHAKWYQIKTKLALCILEKYIFPIIYISEKLKISFNDNLYYIATKV